ncbi:MAG: GNAT family N-acetyltransferase [Gammaproteobacteria bacterium]
MQIIQPATADDYQRYYELRWKILREPWKQPRGSERDSLDDSSTHLMVIDAGHAVLGVGRLHFNTIREAQIRYMAIDPGHQRKGIGSRLLNALEERAGALGAARIVLDARETALGFYSKNGYQPRGPGHTLYGCIAHVVMEKQLGR